tara:strand:- start:945 stop:2609 length:1665 start_codon:yes stop_codon:yes gene_type:complete
MADFWGGFGKGFAPSFERSWESAEKRDEKAEARKAVLDAAKLAAQEKLDLEMQEDRAQIQADRMQIADPAFRKLPALRGAFSPPPVSRAPATQIPLGVDDTGPIGPDQRFLPEFREPLPDRGIDEVLRGLSREKTKRLMKESGLVADRWRTEEDRDWSMAKVYEGRAYDWDKLMESRNYAQILEDNKRGYAESVRINIKDDVEAQRMLQKIEDFTMNGEIAAGRLAAAEGKEEGGNPHPKKVLERGAWLQGYRKEKADILSAGVTAGKIYATKFKAEAGNIKTTWGRTLDKLWGETHDGDEMPADAKSAALSGWEAAKGEAGDLRELKFFQNQYQQALSTPELIAAAPKEYLLWDKAEADFKTNPKDLAEAVRRIYKVSDAKAERIAKDLEDVPWETYNVMDDTGAYKWRTWKIRDGQHERMSPYTEEGKRNRAMANKQLEYESYTPPGPDGMARPDRKHVPVDSDFMKLIFQKDVADLTEEEKKFFGNPEVPALPKAGEKGPVPEKPIKSKILTPDKLKPQVRDDVAKMKIGQKFEMEGKMYKKVEGGIVEVE